MKKQILEALKAKFEGVSDNILDRIATSMAKTVNSESEVAAAVEAVTISKLLESYGDSRATEAQKTAVKTYEEKFKLKDGKPVGSDTGKGTGEGDDDAAKGKKTEDDVPAWAQALIDQNKALQSRLDGVEADKRNTTRRGRLDAIVAKLPESLRAPYSRIDVSSLSDEDFEQSLTDITTEVDSIATTVKSKGAVFGRPRTDAGGSGEETVPQNILNYLDNQNKKDDGGQNF